MIRRSFQKNKNMDVRPHPSTSPRRPRNLSLKRKNIHTNDVTTEREDRVTCFDSCTSIYDPNFLSRFERVQPKSKTASNVPMEEQIDILRTKTEACSEENVVLPSTQTKPEPIRSRKDIRLEDHTAQTASTTRIPDNLPLREEVWSTRFFSTWTAHQT